MSAVGWQAMKAKLIMIMVEGRVELMRPVDPTAIDDHHHLFVGFPTGRHDLVQILTSLLGIKVGHDFREDFRGALLDGADDTQQHPGSDATPRAILQPRLAFQGLLTFDLTLTQGAGGEARALGCAPPACAGQGKAPEHRFIFIEQNDLTPACSILQGSECEGAIREVCGMGIKTPGGTIVTNGVSLLKLYNHLVFYKLNSAIERGTKPDAWGWKPCHWTSTLNAAMVNARRAPKHVHTRCMTRLKWQTTVSIERTVSTSIRSCHSPR